MYLLCLSSVKTTLRRLSVMTDAIFQWQLASAGARFQDCDFVVSYITIFSIGHTSIGDVCSIGEMCSTTRFFNIGYLARCVRVKK